MLLQLSAIAVTGGLDPEEQDALFELRLNSQREGNSGLSWEEPAAASAPLPCGASVRARLQPASADASQALSAALHVKRDRGRPRMARHRPQCRGECTVGFRTRRKQQVTEGKKPRIAPGGKGIKPRCGSSL